MSETPQQVPCETVRPAAKSAGAPVLEADVRAREAMSGTVTLLYRGEPGPPEINLTKIVEFLGGTVRAVEIGGDGGLSGAKLEELTRNSRCLITSAQALSAIDGRKALLAATEKMLVYGFGCGANDNPLIRELTGDSLGGVAPVPAGGGRIAVSQEHRDVCRQFTGLSFGLAEPDRHWSFVGGAGSDGHETLAYLERKPFFVRAGGRDSGLMLLAGERIADIDSPVPREKSILEFFPGLAPVLMFLRYSCPDELWHTERSRACFIIDDPLLKERYGCLDFRKLSYLMDQRRFSTSVAFIPWNYRRTDRRMAELFAGEAARYSLCVHGCDHTRGEFGGADAALLAGKARQALERMAMHRERSGVAFDDVMVFPQGIFSTAALTALKQCDYLAAVNTSPYPVDATGSLCLRDLLQVAVTRFPGVPLFTRRYPAQLAEIAFDLFLGKPALVVEHHAFFRDGYEAVASVVEKLEAMDARLEWTNLGRICSQACVQQRAANGAVHVRFLTNRFVLRNETDVPQAYFLCRHTHAGSDEVTAVVNGRPTDLGREGDDVRLEMTLAAGETADVRLYMAEAAPGTLAGDDRALRRARVFLRRRLSEFRDNYVDGGGLLSRLLRAR